MYHRCQIAQSYDGADSGDLDYGAEMKTCSQAGFTPYTNCHASMSPGFC